jgi:hypothetical protein
MKSSAPESAQLYRVGYTPQAAAPIVKVCDLSKQPRMAVAV